MKVRKGDEEQSDNSQGAKGVGEKDKENQHPRFSVGDKAIQIVKGTPT